MQTLQRATAKDASAVSQKEKGRGHLKMRGKKGRGRDKLYGRRWRKARRQFLADNPYCKMCQDEGRITPATEVDHIEKHDGDVILFWNIENWQGLCAYHHRSVKAEMERSGKVRGAKKDGTPIDPNHPWNQD